MLPTIASVAGPTERRYLEQLPALYQWADIAMPYNIPRPSFTVMDATAADALAEAGGAFALLSDNNAWVQLGRSGLPETVRVVCDNLTTLEERCCQLADRVRSDSSAVVAAEHLEKAIVMQLNELSIVLMEWDKPRPHKALNCTVTQVSEWLLALRWEFNRVEHGKDSPSTWPLIKLARVLASLARTLLREGRRQNPVGVAAWKQVGSDGDSSQERRISVAEWVARHGVLVIPHLLSMMYSDGVTRLVTLRETDGW
jgi:hypothetical protein